MRNKSEELPPLPPAYSWRTINGQHQAWWKGGAKFWTRKAWTGHDYARKAVTIEDVVAKCWAKWTEDTGLTQERYLYLLRCDQLVSQI